MTLPKEVYYLQRTLEQMESPTNTQTKSQSDPATSQLVNLSMHGAKIGAKKEKEK